MALKKILSVSGKAVSVPGNDVDTDRIIPARFMKCVSFDNLGQYAFYDERFTMEGLQKPHPLNDPRYKGATILICGSNFGCGSSREHAPQALYRYGFRAFLAESYAEIFFGNATTLGIPCLSLSPESLGQLTQISHAEPSVEFIIDMTSCKVTTQGMSFQGALPEYARNVLIQGKWDSIAELLEGLPLVKNFKLPYFC